MANWGNAAAGAGTGALYGAKFGGPWGAAIGAAGGGLLGLFSKKTPKKPKTLSAFDPKQQKLYGQYFDALQGGGGPLGDIFGQYNPEELRQLFQQSYAQPAYQKFQEQIVPTITGQFRGGNLQNSSYLGGALGKAGSDVQNNLNSNLAQILYQSKQDQLNRRSQGVQHFLGMNTFDYQKPQPSIFDNLLNSMAGGAGQLLAKSFTDGG